MSAGDAFLNAAIAAACACAVIGAVASAVGVTALIMEHFDRKRRGDRVAAQRIRDGVAEWRGYR